MLIADILREKGAHVETTKSSTRLIDAIKMLATQRIGALLVSEDGRTIDGILSERDVVRALAEDSIEFSERKVGDLMTRGVYTCSPDATVASVMELMDEKRIRHVPVTVNDILAGVVSVRDIVNARLQEAESESAELANYIARPSLS